MLLNKRIKGISKEFLRLKLLQLLFFNKYLHIYNNSKQ